MKEYIIQFDEESDNIPAFLKEQFLGLYSDQEVVRCKDCIFNRAKDWVDCFNNGMFGRTTDNFCSRGEKK